MKKRIIVLILVLLMTTNNISFGLSGYKDKAKAYLLADFDTGQILYSYNIDQSLEIASISKLLSAFVVMDEIKSGRVTYDDTITIEKDVTKLTGSSYKLKEGEVFTLKKLLIAAIVISGNDATYAMAKHVAGTEEEFVKLMKAKAEELGLSHAEIYNSSGLPLTNNGIQNKMSTRDVYIIVRSLLETHPELLEISKIPFISEPSRRFFEFNTNPLLKLIDGVSGLKTGSTIKAGYCFVSTINIVGEPRKSENLKFIGIVMGSSNYEDRTDVSKALVQYGKDNYINKIMLHDELSLKQIEIKDGAPDYINIYPEEGFSKLVNKKDDIKLDIQLSDVSLPIKKNSKLGTVTVIENNKAIFTTNIINKVAVEEADFISKLSLFYSRLFKNTEIIFNPEN